MREKKKFRLLNNWLPPLSEWSGDLLLTDPSREVEVVCLCSGKSGSTSLVQSFAALGFNVLQVHNTPYFLKRVVHKPCPPYDGFTVMDYVNWLNRKSPDPVVIVDAFRDPIDRKISAFFQTLRRGHLPIINRITGENLAWPEFLEHYTEHVDALIHIFNCYYLLTFENYHGHDAWKHDGLVMSPEIFDARRRYVCHTHAEKRYIMLRFDDISNWNTIFRTHGFPNFTLADANVSGEKDYGELFRKFRQQYSFAHAVFPSLILDHLHKEKFETFYTQEERQALRAKWMGKVLPTALSEAGDDFDSDTCSGDLATILKRLTQKYARPPPS